MREWLPEGDLAYFISDMVDTLDLSAFHAPYEGDGRRNRPYHPAMMMKVLLYGYAIGVYSSRKIAVRLERDAAFRMLLGSGEVPGHRTICEFRRRHLKDVKRVFVSVVRLAREAGLVTLGKVAMDGTKVQADANRHRSMTYGQMMEEERRVEEEVERLTAAAEARDQAEDAEHGAEVRGDELPEALQRQEGRLATIRQAKERLEEREAHLRAFPGSASGADIGVGSGSEDREVCVQEDDGVPEDHVEGNVTNPGQSDHEDRSGLLATGLPCTSCGGRRGAVDRGGGGGGGCQRSREAECDGG